MLKKKASRFFSGLKKGVAAGKSEVKEQVISIYFSTEKF